MHGCAQHRKATEATGRDNDAAPVPVGRPAEQLEDLGDDTTASDPGGALSAQDGPAADTPRLAGSEPCFGGFWP